MMTKRKMLAALLAGLITLSLAGCGTDKTENTGSDPASTESGITATVTDSTAEPTAESSLPAGTESTTEYTTEKEMYHTDQYMPPEGEYTTVTAADGTSWYKQYATDTVERKPHKVDDGSIVYEESLVKRLPKAPRRKDKI